MYDFTLAMKDAGLVAASAAATVSGAAKIANVGNGRVDGRLVVDVTAIELASNDELYAVAIQGSTKANFADTIEELAVVNMGAAEVLGGDVDSTVGRYEVPFSNVKAGVTYPYLRVYTTVGGAVATGINYVARIEPSV